jgi:pimeloyl-ACP methyl ester carboxylesterase
MGLIFVRTNYPTVTLLSTPSLTCLAICCANTTIHSPGEIAKRLMPQIIEQFVEVGERRVFVRAAGTGPALVLLHQSPQNSRALIPWIERLAERYAVFAPDTPGFGFSDLLPLAQPTIPDYAAALDRLLERLGIARAMVYGVHTGAVTGLRFALDFPARVALLVCDGYARFDAAERQRLLGDYLPPFEPSWDGAHLLWLWARFREQNLFFPWNTPTREARLAYPAPTAAKLHSDITDVLDAGDGYRAGYRAPFLYDDATAAARLKIPARLFYRVEDVLARHLARLPELPTNVVARSIDGGPAALVAACDAEFAAFAPTAAVANASEAIAHASATSRFVEVTPYGLLSFFARQRNGNESEIFLSDVGTPAAMPADTTAEHSVLAPELPGHGASRHWQTDAVSVQNIAAAIAVVVKKRGHSQVTIRAVGAAAAIAACLAEQLGTGCKRLCLIDPIVLDAGEREQFLARLPNTTPHGTGAHLIAAWNWARMRHLFWPWRAADGAAVRLVDAPAPARVHAEVVEITRAGPLWHALWREVLQFDVASSIARCNCPIEVVSSTEAECARIATRLATQLQLSSSATAMAGQISWHSPI